MRSPPPPKKALWKKGLWENLKNPKQALRQQMLMRISLWSLQVRQPDVHGALSHVACHQGKSLRGSHGSGGLTGFRVRGSMHDHSPDSWCQTEPKQQSPALSRLKGVGFGFRFAEHGCALDTLSLCTSEPKALTSSEIHPESNPQPGVHTHTPKNRRKLQSNAFPLSPLHLPPHPPPPTPFPPVAGSWLVESQASLPLPWSASDPKRFIKLYDA